MANYLTLDYLPELTAAQRAGARTLDISPVLPGAEGGEVRGSFLSGDPASAQSPVFSLQAEQGTVYRLESFSGDDPVSLRVYDQSGKALVANDEGDDPGTFTAAPGLTLEQDFIAGWQAPYSGTFFVDASWATSIGSSDYVFLFVDGHKVDSAVNQAPVVASILADVTLNEGAKQFWSVPFTAFADADHNPLTYSAQLSDGSPLPSWLSFDAATRTFSGVSPVDGPDLTVRVTAIDPGKLSVSDEIQITTAESIGGRKIVGTSADDTLKATQYADTISAAAGNDMLIGGAGDDVLRGDSGIDTAVYAGPRQSFQIETVATDVRVTDRTGAEGRDTLSSIERLAFSDENVALDLSGHAGTVAKLMGAVFGPDSLSNKAYIGLGLKFLDDGMSDQALAELAMTAAGKSTPADIVNLLWTNIVGQAPTEQQAQPFIDMLLGGMSVGQLVEFAADTPINVVNIGLVGLAETGLEYFAV